MTFMKRFGALATVGLIATGGQATAESFDTIELGITYNRAECMNWAENVLYRYKANYGAGKISRSSWVVYGWDLRPGDQDVVIMCPVVAGTVDAFLVVHSESTQDNRMFTTGNIEYFWNN